MIDFKELKSRVTMPQVVKMLDLSVRMDGTQLRATCPACAGSNPRTLVITPERGVFYCFSSKKGGDIIALVSHVRNCTFPEAAAYIEANEDKKEYPPIGLVAEHHTLKPLTSLDHTALVPCGLPEDLAELLGLGTASKGLMKSLVAVPLRLPNGHLVGYVGIPIALLSELKLPKRWAI